jgi:aspartate/methionine/tyrosine aminotransferase
LPIVTVGLTHGLALVADMFAGPGRPIAVAKPFWGNYRQTFKVRTGASIFTAPAYRGDSYNCHAIAEALSSVPSGEPAVAILNLPSNPGGYMPTRAERREICSSLLQVAEDRPLMVVCDDAYQGLVYAEGIPRDSLFWDLQSVHERLLPVKVDGATKELAFFGGRVGFLTFPFAPDSPTAAALESKIKCLLRATVGSPVSISQVLALSAVRSPSLGEEVERLRQLLSVRYHRLQDSLGQLDSNRARVLPFNAGCFALLELTEQVGGSSNSIRKRLLEDFGTGLVSIPPNYLRIAFCSIAEEAIPELVNRIGLALEPN